MYPITKEKKQEYNKRYYNKNKENIDFILSRLYIFFKYYNNNYRPIYHLESIIYYLIKIIHEL